MQEIKNGPVNILRVELSEDEVIVPETVKELTDGKGGEEDEQ